MNLEPQKSESEIRNLSGTARLLASLTIVALALIAILVVLDVIPRSAFTEVAAKTGIIAAICHGRRRGDRVSDPPLTQPVPDSPSAEPNHVHVVVLAAGASTRFGSTKQLVRVNGRPLMHTVVSRAVELAGHSVTVVLGAHAGELAPLLKHTPAAVTVNRNWSEGIASSIREGLAHTPTTADAVLIPARRSGRGHDRRPAPADGRVATQSDRNCRRAIRRQRGRPGDFSALEFSRTQ